jgi:hypothetical protein
MPGTPHLLEEHGADHAALRQREAGLVGAQAREVDVHASANALLQATRVVGRQMRSEREVGFLKSLNVRSPLDCSASLSPLGS